MSQNSNKCPQCGAELPASAPGGLCPACLLKRGLETNTVGFTAEKTPPARWVSPTVEELSSRFPELEISRLIGRGGMGAVYQARQKNLDRIVALKILPPEMGNDPAFAERFSREAQAMARLNHPHIVTIHEFGQRDGWYFFVMEYVDGMNLRGLLDTGHVSPKEALVIVPQICEALQYAHDQGIVHRDIKPENILLNKQGHVKIADFGLAKLMGHGVSSSHGRAPTDDTLTRDTGVSPVPGIPSVEERVGHGRDVHVTQDVIGTPQYMAPEQVDRPAEVDHRADIYSLGVVFYQLLTGELPKGQFEPPSKKVKIDVRLDEVVLRALEKEPSLRYQQASEVKTEVETIVSTPGAGIPRDTGVPPVAAYEPANLVTHVRHSRLAIVGVVWAVFAIIALIQKFLEFTGAVLPAGFTPPGDGKWLWVLLRITPALGYTAPFGTTILGWIAVSQIRHSAGRLYGLGLAVFDGLLFPLLVLDGFIGFILGAIIGFGVEMLPLTWKQTNPVGLDHLCWTIVITLTVLFSALVDLWIIRCVWRAVNKPELKSETVLSSATRFGPGRQIMLVLTGFVLAICAGLAVWRIAFHTPPAGVLTSEKMRSMGIPVQAPSLPDPNRPKTPDGKADVVPLAERATPAAFSSVIEETLIAAEEGAMAKGWDLLNDRAVDLPADFASWNANVRSNWLHKANPTLIAEYVDGNARLLMHGVNAILLPNEQWDDLSGETFKFTYCWPPEEAQKWRDVTHWWALDGKKPLTAAIYSDQVAMILQVVDYTEKPRGVKIRYKMLQPAPAEPKGDPKEVARINAEYAQKRFDLVEAEFKAGHASGLELMDAQFERDSALAELNGRANEIPRIKAEYAQKRFEHIEALYKLGGTGGDEYLKAKLERDRAATEATTSPATQPSAKRRRFEPKDGTADKTSWSFNDKPSDLNPQGWAIMANISLNGVVQARLPGQTQDFCRIKLTDGNDDQVTLEIRDLQLKNDLRITLQRDQFAEISINGDRYRVLYPPVFVAVDQPDTSPLALIVVTHVDPAATHPTTQSSRPNRASPEQVAVEDLALEMLVAIREKDDAKLQAMSVDKVKGWREALPRFAMEMRERFMQQTGKPFTLYPGEPLVQGDRAVVKCTGPKELGQVYLVLFFVKTDAGWRNWSLRNAPVNKPMSDFLRIDPAAPRTHDLK